MKLIKRASQVINLPKHFFMKQLLTLLLCLCASFAHAQALDSLKFPIDPDSHLITFSEVVQAPGVSQAELYARAKLWFAGTFKSAKDVEQADEKEAGVVQGTGWQDIYTKVMGLPVLRSSGTLVSW